MPRLSERDQRQATAKLLAGLAIVAAVVVAIVLSPRWFGGPAPASEQEAWPQVCRAVHPEDLDRW